MRQLKITKQITSHDSHSIEKYLQEIGRFDMLSAEEEVALSKRIHEGDQKALQRLVEGNLRFVVSVAKQYQSSGMTLGDLINEGNVGLIKAAHCFDETRGFKFISYAVWWIRQSILQAIADNARLVRLPLNKITSINRLNRKFLRLEQEYQREPTIEELARAMELPEKEIKDAMSIAAHPMSMDAPLVSGDATSSCLHDVLLTNDNEKTDAEREWTRDSLKTEIDRALSTIEEKDAQIIRMYYGLGDYTAMSLDEIATVMNLTSERVRQIKGKAIRKLKDSWRSKQLRAYL